MTEVERLLTDKNIQFFGKGKDILIKCLNPEHDDSNPSLRIDREDGKFHCLSCGFKGNIFSHFNRHNSLTAHKARGLLADLEEILRITWPGFDIPDDAVLETGQFRGIPGRVVKEFNGFTTISLGMADRLVFPIRDSTQKIVGFQGRYTDSDESPKYLAYPEGESFPLYPTAGQTVPINGSIILVEGLLDALYLRGKDITNTVTTFGTKSISFDNIEDKLVPYILMGVAKVYIMMDGDPPGRAAAAHIENCITQKTELVVEVIELPDGEDPASVSDNFIEMLRNHLHSS